MTRAEDVRPGQLFYYRGLLWRCPEPEEEMELFSIEVCGMHGFIRVGPGPAGEQHSCFRFHDVGELIDMSVPYDGGPR